MVASSVLVILPMAGCGAAPEGTPSGPDEVGTSVEAQQVVKPGGGAPLITFDVDSTSAVVDNQVVDTLYVSKGVTFSCEGCVKPSVFARFPGRSGNAVSARPVNNIINAGPQFAAQFGVVKATFTKHASTVTIDAMGMHSEDLGNTTNLPPVGKPWIEAFDDNDQLIAATPDFTVPLGQWQTMTISTGSYNIRSVRFSSSTAAAFPNAMMAVFDNLQFDQQPIKPPPPPILPLPPSIL